MPTKTAIGAERDRKNEANAPLRREHGERRGQSCLLGSAPFCECLYNVHTQLRLRP